MDLTKEEQEELLKIERGYNKDGRPQCKQIVVGQIVNEYGIPINNQVMDGSISDSEWNKKAMEYLEELKRKGFKTGVYVADSKLVTNALVSRMNAQETIRIPLPR
jgi:transposase